MKYVYSYTLGSGIPLGGMGTGSIEVRSDGRLYEWTIFNNGGIADIQSLRNTYFLGPMDSFFAVNGSNPRILQAYNYFYGGDPYNLPWLRPIKRVEFSGEFPFAFLNSDEYELTAFSPFIPNDIKNSSLPVAIFRLKAKETSDFLMGIRNPFEEGKIDTFSNWLVFAGEVSSNDPRYKGNLCVKAIGGDVIPSSLSGDPSQHREMWIDFRNGALKRRYGEKQDWGIIKSRGKQVTFILSWYFPSFYSREGERIGHYYENFFSDCAEVANYVEANLRELEEKTKSFHDVLYNPKGIDRWIADLVGSQLTTLVKSTWLGKDGFFGIWEGYYNTADERKSGPFSYTGGPVRTALNTVDVMIYAFPAIINLFPEIGINYLEEIGRHSIKRNSPPWLLYSLTFPENRELYVREVEKDPTILTELSRIYSLVNKITNVTGKDPEGRIPHFFTTYKKVDGYQRIDLGFEYYLMWYFARKLIGKEVDKVHQEAKDGVYSVLRTQLKDGLPYHSLPSGLEWMREMATNLRDAASYDLEMFRPISLLLAPNVIPISITTLDDWTMIGWTGLTSGLLLATTNAMSQFNEDILNLNETYHKIKKILWNGEYLIDWYEPNSGNKDNACVASQLLGQWVEILAGLPPSIPYEEQISILRSIFKYNYKKEEGVLNGAYPSGYRPNFSGMYEGIGIKASPQVDTPWTGIEFSVASHMMYLGMDDEAKEILKNVYERYELGGNFWNHEEWGAHYMRPLSAWSIPLVLNNMIYDPESGELTIRNQRKIEWIFTFPYAWGKFTSEENYVKLRLLGGFLRIRKIVTERPILNVKVNGVETSGEISLSPGDELEVKW
ncbi:hypothetical protein HS7_01290 [Sulfolobales archaeon HS-7]|nr:hypothetical protein HS7_01290 [Sulfolobales archaeon HS-7]